MIIPGTKFYSGLIERLLKPIMGITYRRNGKSCFAPDAQLSGTADFSHKIWTIGNRL
jgi:hypothetical protein